MAAFLSLERIKLKVYEDSSLTNLVVNVPMKGNKSFPLNLQLGTQIVIGANVCQHAEIWHRRLGYLNVNSLKQLHEQEMVVGLPKLKYVGAIYEGYAFSKHSMDAFPRGATLRASFTLELVHSNICGPIRLGIDTFSLLHMIVLGCA